MKNPLDAKQNVLAVLDKALENSTIAWWEWDIPSNTVVTNDRKVTMLGYNPEDFKDKGYQVFTDLLHPDDYERTMQAMKNHLEGAAPLYQIDYRIKKADGTYTWYMDRGCVLERNEKGAPVRLRGVVVDLGPDINAYSADQELVGKIRQVLPMSTEKKQIASVCSGCKRLRLGSQSWIPVDESFEYIFAESISHGLCPSCVKKFYPEIAEELLTQG